MYTLVLVFSISRKSVVQEFGGIKTHGHTAMNTLMRPLIILIVGTVVLCIFLLSFSTSTQSHRFVSLWAPIRQLAPSPLTIKDDTNEPQNSSSLIAGDGVRYYQLLESYHKTLAAIPRQKYNQSTHDIVKGLPLSTILKENTSDYNKTVKRILAWTTFFGKVDWIPKTICEGEKQSCISVTNRSELADADGIVVHPIDLKGRKDLPSKLLSHQRLIYLLQESPFATGINVGDYNGVFNWTSMYRGDSDSPFTFFSPPIKRNPMADEEFTKTLSNIMAPKNKLVAYMNSNCGAAHTKRLEFIKDVKKHIPVDVYGKCGNLKCPRNTKKCTDKMSQYKFYFALENAHCRDYITEKVHEPLLNWGAVPIVMGGADPSDYEYRLPPNSYIHSAGFPNVTELVEFLQILNRNPQLYLKYHQWRRTHQHGYSDHWCSLCRRLHNTSLPIQYYKNFKGWYEEDVCKA